MRVIDLEKIDPLLAPPAVVPKLLQALSDPHSGTDDIAGLLKLEPALIAKVLAMCNSAYFSNSSPTADIFEAISRVGLNNVYKLVVATVSENAINSVGATPFARQLWRHSVLAGLSAETVADDHRSDRSVMFTAGLLHDFGKLIFVSAAGPVYGDLLERSQGDEAMLLRLERENFKIDHAELGGHLLLKWGFPSDVMWGVRLHHSPEAMKSMCQVAPLVTTADLIAYVCDHPDNLQTGPWLPGAERAFSMLGINEDQIRGYVQNVTSMSQMIRALVKDDPAERPQLVRP